MATSEPSPRAQIALSMTVMEKHGLAAEVAFEVFMEAGEQGLDVSFKAIECAIPAVGSTGLSIYLQNEAGIVYFVVDGRGDSWVVECPAVTKPGMPFPLVAGSNHSELVDRCLRLFGGSDRGLKAECRLQ